MGITVLYMPLNKKVSIIQAHMTCTQPQAPELVGLI